MEIKCPTPCYLCGDVVELSALHFHTSFCGCVECDCAHGLCDDCFYGDDDDSNPL